MELQQLIEKNNLKLKSQEEIFAKFEELKNSASNSLFDFRREVLMSYLTFEAVKSNLTEDYIEEIEAGTKVWEPLTTIDSCVKDFLSYMGFAWGKSEDERGLSASRSIQKLSMWLWLMNRDDLQVIIEDDSLYNPYGAPALIEVCDKMGIEVPKSLREFANHK